MTTNVIHQLAGDARVPRTKEVRINLKLGTDNLTAGDSHKVFKFAKDGYVGNFAIRSDVNLDPHATPTLVLDVGDVSNPDKFIDGATALQLYAGFFTNILAETTIAGTQVLEDSFIVFDIDVGAATATAGTVTITFEYTALEIPA